MTSGRPIRIVVAALAIAILPVAGFPQTASGIAGVVTDTSGAVLPGVTVEASSPALIEKVRSVVTDSQGLYKIMDLRPGTYDVTFTLPSFATVRREGIELSASFTATVNAQLPLGAVEETVTVSGESPVVDIQNVVQQRVVSKDTIDRIPSARSFQTIGALIPGMQIGRVTRLSGQDVGGLAGDRATLAIHGGKTADMAQQLEGLSFGVNNGGGSNASYTVNPAEVLEFGYELGAAAADVETGGVRVNIIPQAGGNRFSGTFFSNFSRPALQSDNLTDELRAQGIRDPNHLVKMWDVHGGFGGPLKKDKLWFWTALRTFGLTETLAGSYFAVDQQAIVRVPDLSRPTLDANENTSASLRLTWQATPRNKVSVYGVHQYTWNSAYAVGVTTAPEAAPNRPKPRIELAQGSWNSPLTSRLLLEAGGLWHNVAVENRPQPGVTPDTISVFEQSTGVRYRAASTFQNQQQNQFGLRAAASYVTGSHAVKAGLTFVKARTSSQLYANHDINYTLRDGVPRAVTQLATPYSRTDLLNGALGLYAQDQWTIKRLTLNGALRFDHINEMVPAQKLPATRFLPAREYAEVRDVPNWNDISPRLGAAYDLFGNGKTAVKMTFGRYLDSERVDFSGQNNPVQTSVNTATRTWTDTNRNFVPDCDLTNRLANGECGQINPLSFGQPRITTVYDDRVKSGWGVRQQNWEMSVAIQHELRPGMAVNLGYFRRWYGNFLATDNLAWIPADFDEFCITAPADPRLPGGGNQICGLYDIKPTKFGVVDNLVTFASKYGKQSEVYNGFDLTVNARLPHRSMVQGGFNAGRTATDACFVVDSPGALLFCERKPAFFAESQIKLLGAVGLPWGLDAAATFQSLPGPEITASYAATNAEVKWRDPTLQRTLAQGASGTVTVPLIQPGTQYGPRMYQLDGRVSRVFRVGQIRVKGNVDIYNLLNASPVLVLNTTFGPNWQRPSYILPGRLVKVGVQVDF